MKRTGIIALVLGVALFFGNFAIAETTDPLPSWSNGRAKQTIINFVGKVTEQGSPDFVPPAERIATFDNDGTLWAEQPMYFQLLFALDRVKALAPNYPEWKDKEPFASLLKGDVTAALAGGEQAMLEIIKETHAGMTTDEFEKIVEEWISTSQHPTKKRPYTEMVYQPMLELLAYLRANGFKTFIVSGGGIEFMRPWVERVYGIPPEQVVGSSIKTKYDIRDDKPVLVRLPELNFMNDKDGKPIGIHTQIGRRPIAAFGNSMATCRCWNGPLRDRARDWQSTYITQMLRANGPMTATPPSAVWTRVSTKRGKKVGPWQTWNRIGRSSTLAGKGKGCLGSPANKKLQWATLDIRGTDCIKAKHIVEAVIAAADDAINRKG